MVLGMAALRATIVGPWNQGADGGYRHLAQRPGLPDTTALRTLPLIVWPLALGRANCENPTMIEIATIADTVPLLTTPEGWFDYGYTALADGRLALVRTRQDVHAEHMRWGGRERRRPVAEISKGLGCRHAAVDI
jgi:hypothetical protein